MLSLMKQIAAFAVLGLGLSFTVGCTEPNPAWHTDEEYAAARMAGAPVDSGSISREPTVTPLPAAPAATPATSPAIDFIPSRVVFTGKVYRLGPAGKTLVHTGTMALERTSARAGVSCSFNSDLWAIVPGTIWWQTISLPLGTRIELAVDSYPSNFPLADQVNPPATAPGTSQRTFGGNEPKQAIFLSAWQTISSSADKAVEKMAAAMACP